MCRDSFHFVIKYRKEDEQKVKEELRKIFEVKAKQFAEWCSEKHWNYNSLSKKWLNLDKMEFKTRSELYTLFNNQNK